jgi:anti-sigma factor RsiW
MSPLAHPIPAEWLTAYHDGELEAGRRQQVAAHLAECADCRRELAELETLRQTLASAELPQAAFTSADAFWRDVQPQLPERQPARPNGAPVNARGVLLRWSPGILLLLLNGAVQVAAVAAATYLLLAAALQWTPAWATGLLRLATGFTLGWPTWLLPANWGGWELLGFWLVVSVELAVLYLAWLAYELRYGPLTTFGRAALRGD